MSRSAQPGSPASAPLAGGGRLVELGRGRVASACVGEPDPVELDLAAQRARIERARPVDHVGLGVEQVEDLVQRRHPLLVGGVELRDLLDRVEEQLQIADERDDDPDLDVAVDRLVAAVEDDRGRPDRGQQLDRREVGRVEVDRAHVGLAVGLVELRHAADVRGLAAERAHDSDARQRLLQVGGDVGDLLPRQPVGARRRDPEDDARDREQREGQERDERQRDVEGEQDHDHADERQRAREQRHDAVGDQAVERLDVVGQARDQDARACAA